MTNAADICISDLLICVLGRQFPSANDYWDGNWLNIHVRVDTGGAAVKASCAILRTDELNSFTTEPERLDAELSGIAARVIGSLRKHLRSIARSELLWRHRHRGWSLSRPVWNLTPIKSAND